VAWISKLSFAGYFYYSQNLNWATQNPLLGRGLDIADLEKGFSSQG